METLAFQKALEMVYSRLLESCDLFKGCALEAHSQSCALYLSFLADKKAGQASLIESISAAYGFHLNEEPATIHQRFLRYEHELLASSLGGIYDTVMAMSEDDISHFSTVLSFEADDKIRSILTAAVDYEQDFMLDAQRGYLRCLENAGVPEATAPGTPERFYDYNLNRRAGILAEVDGL